MSGALYWEDLIPGVSWETAGATLSEAAIMDFAFRFDPQPFHIDAHAAAASDYGGLIASGFHTLSIAFRLVWDSGRLSGTNLGGKGLDQLRWPRAVRPGDTICVRVEVIEQTPSRRADRGNVRLRYTARNQDDHEIMTAEVLHVVRRKDT